MDIRLDGIDKRFEGIDKHLDGMDKRLAGMDKRFEGIDKRFEGMDKRFASLEGLISEMSRDLKLLFNQFTRPSADAGSPLKLTDRGHRISETVCAADWAREQAPGLVANAAGKEEFEVFDICIDHVAKVFKHDLEFRKIVRRGAYEIGTDEQDVRTVYHIELRDQLLKLI